MTRLRDLVAPCFYKVWSSIKKNAYTHYWFSGGRSSTKSSFISLAIVLLLMKDPEANAIVFRKVKDSIGDSVFEQLLWAIDILGLSAYFTATKSPFKIEYVPTGQRILFRGMDDPQKIKSIKLKKGYFKLAWFEELAEFNGLEEVESAILSIMRGGEGKKFTYFYSYNPPERMSNWVNAEAALDKPNRIVIKNSYIDVPKEWLGESFLAEAEHVKRTNETRYRHVYLGEVTGTGGTVFPNAEKLEMSDELIAQFDNIRQGVDWGFVVDPFAFVKLHYDKTRRSIYIFDEIYKVGLSNRNAIELVDKKADPLVPIYADSAEPKSIREFKDAGIYMKPAEKGPGSVEYGIKFLQSMDHIYIDPNRCPNSWREFSLYELEKDRQGNWKDTPPDKENHCLAGNTLISTDKGLVKIKDVRVGDWVLTRKGYRRVLWSGCSARNKQVYKVRTVNGRYLVGTGNHKVFTSRGFVRIDKLQKGDELLTDRSIELCKQLKPSLCSEKNGIDTQTQKEEVTGCISKVGAHICTTLCGKDTTAKEEKGMLSIIKTVTREIMKLRTWKKSLQKSMSGKSTKQQVKGCNLQGKTWIEQEPLQIYGTVAPKGLNGTKNMPKSLISERLTMGSVNVSNVVKSTKGNRPKQGSVAIIVSQNGVEKPGLTTSLNDASGVEKSSCQINTRGQDFVVKVVSVGIAKAVYDLTIEDKHEFFANGILVHNCIDSVRYSVCKDNTLL